MVTFIESNGCRLHCERKGEGKPLLLIHGVASDTTYFERAMDLLCNEYDVVSYDRRAYSESCFLSGEIGDMSVAAQVEDARLVLQSIFEQPAIVVGISAGGIIALELSKKYPELISETVLYEPPLAVTEEGNAAIHKWKADMYASAAKKRLTRVLLIFVEVIGGVDPLSESVSFEQQVKNLSNMDIFLKYEMDEFLNYTDHAAKKEDLRVKLTLGSGTLNEKGLFSEETRHTAKYYDAAFYPAEGYHNLPKERPEVFAEWLKSIIGDK